MTIAEAIEILRRHNAWRRDDTGQIEILEPATVGIAIDTVCDYCEQIELEAL